jgi:hypothetical protein
LRNPGNAADFVSHAVFICCTAAAQLPIVTRYYVTLSFLTTAGCALEVRGGERPLRRRGHGGRLLLRDERARRFSQSQALCAAMLHALAVVTSGSQQQTSPHPAACAILMPFPTLPDYHAFQRVL